MKEEHRVFITPPPPSLSFLKYLSGWLRFWLVHISLVLLVFAFWKQEWHSVVGWWRGAVLGQTGWGRGCHCKQSSAYSWNEMTLWQWRLLCFWSSPVSLNCKSFGSHLFPSAPPPTVLPPANCSCVIAGGKKCRKKASLFYLHIEKQDLSSTFSHSYRGPDWIKQTLIWW